MQVREKQYLHELANCFLELAHNHQHLVVVGVHFAEVILETLQNIRY